jgi:DEAD/DEAH box helicase domain-containing protein
VLVAGDDALDQYHIQHPEAFFGRAIEQAAVDPSNASIQLGHLVCAAAERALEPDDLHLFPTNAQRLVDRLTEAGELGQGPPWPARGQRVHGAVSLRGTSREPFTLQAGHGSIGTIEPPYLQRECYPGALYLHNGRGYRVLAIDRIARVVRLVDDSVEARTSPLVEVRVAPRDEALATRQLSVGEAQLVATVGPLQVCETVAGYREARRGQSHTCALDEPLDSVLDTVGLWVDIPEELEPDQASLHAMEHGLVNAVPLALLCDRRDIGSSSDGRRVYLYDFAEGGIGLVEKAFHVLETLLDRAATLLRDCPCTDGCPSCMHLPGCPQGNGALDKVGGLALLEGRGVGGARVAERLLRGPSARTPESGGGSARRGRLRAIADADLRERYGASPKWLEVGGLAQLVSVGVVVVWSIGRGTAEVQSLGGGESHWVPISALSPPRAT